jgi:hypothetical protein
MCRNTYTSPDARQLREDRAVLAAEVRLAAARQPHLVRIDHEALELIPAALAALLLRAAEQDLETALLQRVEIIAFDFECRSAGSAKTPRPMPSAHSC